MDSQQNLGFTLIETLVSIVIITILGIVVASLLSQTFQANNKTQLLGQIKQNGQSALNYIDQVIRTADSVVCVGDSTIDILSNPNPDDQVSYGNTIVTKKSKDALTDIYTRIRILTDTQSPPSGSILIDNQAPPNLNAPYTLCGSANSMLNPISLVDTNSTGLVVKDYSSGQFFALNKHPASNDTVQISFYLSPNSAGSSTFENTIGDTNKQFFQTTVSLR